MGGSPSDAILISSSKTYECVKNNESVCGNRKDDNVLRIRTSLLMSLGKPGVKGAGSPEVLSLDNLAILAAMISLSRCLTIASTANHSVIVVS